MSHLTALISDNNSLHVSQDAVVTALFKVVAMGDCGFEPSEIDRFMEIRFMEIMGDSLSDEGSPSLSFDLEDIESNPQEWYLQEARLSEQLYSLALADLTKKLRVLINNVDKHMTFLTRQIDTLSEFVQKAEDTLSNLTRQIFVLCNVDRRRKLAILHFSTASLQDQLTALQTSKNSLQADLASMKSTLAECQEMLPTKQPVEPSSGNLQIKKLFEPSFQQIKDLFSQTATASQQSDILIEGLQKNFDSVQKEIQTKEGVLSDRTSYDKLCASLILARSEHTRARADLTKVETLIRNEKQRKHTEKAAIEKQIAELKNKYEKELDSLKQQRDAAMVTEGDLSRFSMTLSMLDGQTMRPLRGGTDRINTQGVEKSLLGLSKNTVKQRYPKIYNALYPEQGVQAKPANQHVMVVEDSDDDDETVMTQSLKQNTAEKTTATPQIQEIADQVYAQIKNGTREVKPSRLVETILELNTQRVPPLTGKDIFDVIQALPDKIMNKKAIKKPTLSGVTIIMGQLKNKKTADAASKGGEVVGHTELSSFSSQSPPNASVIPNNGTKRLAGSSDSTQKCKIPKRSSCRLAEAKSLLPLSDAEYSDFARAIQASLNDQRNKPDNRDSDGAGPAITRANKDTGGPAVLGNMDNMDTDGDESAITLANEETDGGGSSDEDATTVEGGGKFTFYDSYSPPPDNPTLGVL